MTTVGPLAPEALDTLLAQRGRFVASAKRWLTDADAEDVVQEAYLKALLSGAALRRAQRSHAWFQRVLHNATIDRLRHGEAERRARVLYASGAVDHAEAADTRLTSCHCLRRALASLRPQQRDVIRRVDLEEVSIAEAAAALGVSVNNLRVRLHRARTALRRCLVDLCDAGECDDCACQARSNAANRADPAVIPERGRASIGYTGCLSAQEGGGDDVPANLAALINSGVGLHRRGRTSSRNDNFLMIGTLAPALLPCSRFTYTGAPWGFHRRSPANAGADLASVRNGSPVT